MKTVINEIQMEKTVVKIISKRNKSAKVGQLIHLKDKVKSVYTVK